jgi:hypothetical protein
MKKCVAFSALVGSRDAWKPCSRRASRGSQFCGRHTEVAAGIMLGLCVHDLLSGGAPPAQASASPHSAAKTANTLREPGNVPVVRLQK